MRPQEPSVPPFRTTGPGGTSRPDAPGPIGSDGYGGRAPAHARPDDEDPYGDVPAPPPAGHGSGNGVRAPYGASGWSGSDGHEPAPPGPLDGGRRGATPYGGSQGAPGHGSRAPTAGPSGPGPHGAPAPVPPGGPGWGGPPWAASPPPPPFGVPRPDAARSPSPPGSGNGTARPPASPAASPPDGSSRPGPGPRPEPTAGSSASPASSGSSGSPASAPASPSRSDDGGLAGSDGFASRPPRPSPDTSTATATTSTTTTSTTTTGTTRTSGAGTGPGRHRRAGTGPGRDDEDAPEGAEDADDTGGGAGRRAGKGKGKGKRKGSFWRELPLLIVVAVVLTFVIQTFLARIYVIPSASMERTLHGCNGCANDRVAVDKVTYRFSDPAPGDVVVFRGPPAWGDNGEVSGSQRSDNVLVRGLQSGLSLVGLAPPDEKDFVKRVIAVGGQTVACCDPQNRVTVDGQPLDEPYLYFQPNLGRTQADFPPVQVPQGQLWVMGDNRNNSADARVHGPIAVDDVIGKARVIVLPVGRWGGVPDTDPQARPSALGAPAWTSAAPLAAGVVGAAPLVVLSRRWRRSLHRGATGPVPAEGGPAPPPSPGDPDR
ncbi:signal peptidase I [Actinomycetospora cinnamomea]|uniref:Signal peptidase I n=1 Tax=Actinomycetospora cinnamomea TaxID=663609 RepID=A0A2U1FQS4_9PSEU|nr:signal peptidase I [Actinomycetospora cinnamomea]